ARGVDRFVGQDGHQTMFSVRRLGQVSQHVVDTCIDGRVGELVETVIGKEIFQRLTEQSFIAVFSEGSPHERRRSVSYVACYNVAVEFWTSDISQHCVHGVDQIKSRVDQGAVKIEDQQTEALRIKLAEKTNHESSGKISRQFY